MRMLALFFSFFLLSSTAFSAEWGDTFFCEETHNHFISADGEFKKYKPQKFRFQLNEEKNAMVFGKTGFYRNMEFTLQPKATFLKVDYWEFYAPFMTGVYDKGLLVLAMATVGDGITSARSTCDTFK